MRKLSTSYDTVLPRTLANLITPKSYFGTYSNIVSVSAKYDQHMQDDDYNAYFLCSVHQCATDTNRCGP